MKWTMLALRLTLELVVLAAYAVWGWSLVDGPQRFLTGALALVLVASVWGIFIAPKSTQRLADPARLATEVGVFLGAGAAVWGLGHPWWGGLLAAVAIADAVAVRRWEAEVVPSVDRG